MIKRKQRASARKKTASKRGKAHTRIKSSPRKSAKRVGRKTRAEKATKRDAVKTKAKKQTIKPRAKRTAPKKAVAPPSGAPTQLAEATEETVIVDIIDEPVPGVVVVTEFESVRISRPETDTPQSEGKEGSGIAERKEEEH
jgi:hypothetical protein